MWGFITITKFEYAADIQLKKRESRQREAEEIDCSFFLHAQTKLSIYTAVTPLILLKIMDLPPLDRTVYIGAVSNNDEELLLQILDADST